MQSPAARSSREIYARAIEMALTAERLGGLGHVDPAREDFL